jgi:hypothetical protein
MMNLHGLLVLKSGTVAAAKALLLNIEKRALAERLLFLFGKSQLLWVTSSNLKLEEPYNAFGISADGIAGR